MQDDRKSYRITKLYIGIKKKKGRQKIKWTNEISNLINNKNYEQIARDRIE